MKAGSEQVLPVDSAVRVLGLLLGKEGPWGCRAQLSPTWPMTGSGVETPPGWHVEPKSVPWPLGLVSGNSEFKSFGSRPPHEVLSAKGPSQKEKSGLLSFKKYTLKYRKGERKHLLLYHKQ